MKFKADKVSIRGPKVDGSYVVSLEVGEYERNKLTEILTLPEGVVDVTIYQESQKN